mgnify:CR=1 FL=1
MSATETEVTPSADMEIETVYSSDAYFGVKAVGDAVTEREIIAFVAVPVLTVA